jgi:hypothetical protein
MTAAVHPSLSAGAKENLSRRGFTVIEMPFTDDVDPRIKGHPDLQIFSAYGVTFVHRNFPAGTEKLISGKCRVIRCDTELGKTYPEDCPFNIAFTGTYALYKKGTIPAEIDRFFDIHGITRVHVPQGYARCSTIPLAENAIATEDGGIASAAEKAGLSVRRLTPGLIPLEGFPSGFAGGAFGLHGKTLFATGRLPDDPAYEGLRNDCIELGIELCELSGEPARDFGSFLFF